MLRDCVAEVVVIYTVLDDGAEVVVVYDICCMVSYYVGVVVVYDDVCSDLTNALVVDSIDALSDFLGNTLDD